MKEIRCKDGAYGHEAQIEVDERGHCDLCKKDKKVLWIDTSQGEYATFQICKDCFLKEVETE